MYHLNIMSVSEASCSARVLCCRFLAQQLGREFERVAEAILPSLIQLMPNSAKIMSTSGTIAIRFIVRVSHSIT